MYAEKEFTQKKNLHVAKYLACKKKLASRFRVFQNTSTTPCYVNDSNKGSSLVDILGVNWIIRVYSCYLHESLITHDFFLSTCSGHTVRALVDVQILEFWKRFLTLLAHEGLLFGSLMVDDRIVSDNVKVKHGQRCGYCAQVQVKMTGRRHAPGCWLCRWTEHPPCLSWRTWRNPGKVQEE